MNLSLLHFYTFFLFRWSCSYNIMLYKHATQRQIYSKEKMVCFNLACKKTAEKRQQIHWWLCDRDRKCILYIKCALKQAQRLKKYGRLVCVVVSMIFDFFFVCRLPFKSINRTSAHRSYWIWNEKKTTKQIHTQEFCYCCAVVIFDEFTKTSQRNGIFFAYFTNY